MGSELFGMTWACICFGCIKSVQIREICVRIYDGSCNLLEQRHAVLGKGGQLMSDEEYRAVKISLSNQLNLWLENVDRIVLWEMSSYKLLKEAIQQYNKAERYIVVLSTSRYVDKESARLQLLVQRKGVSKCESMCETLSDIAIKLLRNNDYFIRQFLVFQ